MLYGSNADDLEDGVIEPPLRTSPFVVAKNGGDDSHPDAPLIKKPSTSYVQRRKSHPRSKSKRSFDVASFLADDTQATPDSPARDDDAMIKFSSYSREALGTELDFETFAKLVRRAEGGRGGVSVSEERLRMRFSSLKSATTNKVKKHVDIKGKKG